MVGTSLKNRVVILRNTGSTTGAVVKIFLLGATGNSGRRILRLALQRAHEVTAFVRDETKLLSVVDRPIPPNLHVFVGDTSKSADIARVMVGHDVAINAAGHVTKGSTFTQLVQTVVDSAIASLGEGGRLWQFGGAAVLESSHICTIEELTSEELTSAGSLDPVTSSDFLPARTESPQPHDLPYEQYGAAHREFQCYPAQPRTHSPILGHWRELPNINFSDPGVK